MGVEMKVNANLIRKLRDDNGWSQEHLASVSGLSVRTVQRLEAEGSGSRESKMALAAAFGIATADLSPDAPHPDAEVLAVAADGRDPDRFPGDAAYRAIWLVIGLAAVLLLIAQFGYGIGKDAAVRDNAADDAERCAQDSAHCATPARPAADR